MAPAGRILLRQGYGGRGKSDPYINSAKQAWQLQIKSDPERVAHYVGTGIVKVVWIPAYYPPSLKLRRTQSAGMTEG